MKRSTALVVLSTVIVGGCALGLGGSDPLERDVLALRVPAGMTAEQLGSRLQQGGYEFALLVATQDSGWLAAAAAQAGLQMTRPGHVGDAHYVFFGPAALGDTTHVIAVRSGGSVRLHDALFELDKQHHVDLILARFDSVADLREGVRSLLSYVAKDVSGNAALLLGIETPTQQFGDSVAVLIRAAYLDTRECAEQNAGTAAVPSTIRLFYGPQLHVRCDNASVLNEAGGPVSARFVLP